MEMIFVHDIFKNYFSVAEGGCEMTHLSQERGRVWELATYVFYLFFHST